MIEYIFVDSRTRDVALYPSGNSYSMYLVNPLTNITKVSLVSAKFPNSFFNFTSQGSFMNVNSNPVYLPTGYYSAQSLTNELTYYSSLTTAGISVIYSATDGKFIFFTSSSSPLTITATTAQSALLLGMPLNVAQTFVNSSTTIYATNTYYSGKYLVKSPNVCDFTANDTVFLDIEEMRNNKLNLTSKLTGNTIVNTMASRSFGPITLDVMAGVIKTFKENGDYTLEINFPEVISKLYRLTVNWRDINGNLVSFNGNENNSFILKIDRSETPVCLPFSQGLPPPVPTDFMFSSKYMILVVLGLGLLIIMVQKNI